MIRERKSGFTIVELMVAMVLSGLVAVFIIPKVLHSNEDAKHKSAIRDGFTIIGEAYLARKGDGSVIPEDLIDGQENKRFASYLYDHLNYTIAIDPANYTEISLCSTTDDYFVLPMGTTIKRICPDTIAPRSLNVEIFVPKRNSPGTTFWIIFPEDSANPGTSQDRYTTVFGMTGNTADCTFADKVLNIGC
jgi:prepilin-type N-terminal cleavage/methylation domain-containing protein